MKKKIPAEEHHRRPRSLGGDSTVANTTYVPMYEHRCWHVLFGNMNAEQICNNINSSSWKPKGVTIVCKFINGKEVMLRGKHNSKKNSKRQDAWNKLFGKLGSFQEIISYINNVWLDPSYHF